MAGANVVGASPNARGALSAHDLTAWKRSIASVTGRPLSLKLPIHRTIVVRLLAWRPTPVAWNRTRLATALATIACLRISEVAYLQVCDLSFDHFTG